jgi:hypothetical protein
MGSVWLPGSSDPMAPRAARGSRVKRGRMASRLAGASSRTARRTTSGSTAQIDEWLRRAIQLWGATRLGH